MVAGGDRPCRARPVVRGLCLRAARRAPPSTTRRTPTSAPPSLAAVGLLAGSMTTAAVGGALGAAYRRRPGARLRAQVSDGLRRHPSRPDRAALGAWPAPLIAPGGRQARPRTSPTSPARCARPGCRSGPGRVLDAIRAVEAAGFTDRRDFYYTLQACFVSRPEHRAVFAQVFRLFWRDPQFLEHMMSLLTPLVRGRRDAPPSRRRRSGARPRRCSTAPRRRPRARGGGGRGDRARREAHLLGRRAAEGDGLRADVGRRAGGGAARHRAAGAAGAADRQPAHPGRPARAGGRLARHDARGAALGRRGAARW